ncbi:SWR1 complex subunit 2-like [Phragmites australis]|uniref:SWR1 complex subunit 2-like n=1 Tax=Phragmites australis TaxID=29695 RepID=UPI002D77FAF0|nr:SWR1 complex subunit 2-like [Phragmites australis]
MVASTSSSALTLSSSKLIDGWHRGRVPSMKRCQSSSHWEEERSSSEEEMSVEEAVITSSDDGGGDGEKPEVEEERRWRTRYHDDDSEENDVNYEEEQDAGDEFDSDFGEDESEPDDEPEKEVRERLPIKKRLIFPGKTLSKTKTKKKVVPKLDDAKTDKSDKPGPSRQADVPDEFENEKTIRKSTRTSVIVRQAEREAMRAEKEAIVKQIKKKKEGEEKRMTQEEMLLEAAETVIMNLRNLERVLAREEEVKKKAVVHKDTYGGPTIRFWSRDGESHLEFINGASFASELCTTSAPYPEKSVCVVTGLPAKYCDPKTGLPYATMEAFKIIRESFLKEEADKKRPNMSNMGELFESITGDHLTPKKRRIEIRSPNISAGRRLGGRFRRIPALDTTVD